MKKIFFMTLILFILWSFFISNIYAVPLFNNEDERIEYEINYQHYVEEEKMDNYIICVIKQLIFGLIIIALILLLFYIIKGKLNIEKNIYVKMILSDLCMFATNATVMFYNAGGNFNMSTSSNFTIIFPAILSAIIIGLFIDKNTKSKTINIVTTLVILSSITISYFIYNNINYISTYVY